MKRILLLLLLPLLWATAAPGQSFSSLWKQVNEAESDDLPRTALKYTAQIRQKAAAEGDVPQAMRALLTEARLWTGIAPDSAAAATARMEEALARTTDPVEQALWHSALGRSYAATALRDTAQAARAVRHLLASVSRFDTLADVAASDYGALLVAGTDSKRFYADDLLSVLLLAATDGLQTLETTTAGPAGERLALLRRAAAFYRDRGNRPAALLADIDWLEARYERAGNDSVTAHFAALLQLARDNAPLPENVETYVAITQLHYASGPDAAATLPDVADLVAQARRGIEL